MLVITLVLAVSLRQGLGLWRGEPLADVQVCMSLEAESARLQVALSAIEDRIDAELDCGCHHAAAAELDGLVVSHPLRERLWAQRVLALYRCGREAEAVRACSSFRRRLAAARRTGRGEAGGLRACRECRARGASGSSLAAEPGLVP